MTKDALLFKLKEKFDKKEGLFKNQRINRIEIFFNDHEDGFRVDFYKDYKIITQYIMDTYPDCKPEDKKIEKIDIVKNKIISICYHAILSRNKFSYNYWIFILKILCIVANRIKFEGQHVISLNYNIKVKSLENKLDIEIELMKHDKNKFEYRIKGEDYLKAEKIIKKYIDKKNMIENEHQNFNGVIVNKNMYKFLMEKILLDKKIINYRIGMMHKQLERILVNVNSRTHFKKGKGILNVIILIDKSKKIFKTVGQVKKYDPYNNNMLVNELLKKYKKPSIKYYKKLEKCDIKESCFDCKSFDSQQKNMYLCHADRCPDLHLSEDEKKKYIDSYSKRKKRKIKTEKRGNVRKK